jgi:hypothetical protein
MGSRPQPADLKAEADRLIRYHSGVSAAMTAERTSLESALIPVTAYIVVSAAECWYRHPEIIRAIDAAMPAEEIGAKGRRPGVQINPVYLWSTANIFLTGRKALTSFGLAEDSAEAVYTVLDFWERAALAYRGDGHRQAWDAGFVVRPYGDDVLAQLRAGVRPVTDDMARAAIKRFNATVLAYLFLLYFDTRVGTGDSGPYPVPGHPDQVMLVRDFYRMAKSDFWWSEVARDVPYQNLTCALVLDRVQLKVNDWGTSITDPEDYLDRVVGFAVFTSDTPDGSLKEVPLSELDGIVAEVRKAQAQHYRNVAAMSRDEKIRCGAYVYFTFPRPFAELAGVADAIDWEVPRDTLANGLYPIFAPLEGTNTGPESPEEYYLPIGIKPAFWGETAVVDQ